jgi:hydrocephalus-inducing protein
LPLIPKESSTRVSINSSELGIYQYELHLTSISAGPERSLHFKVGLGTSQLQIFRFLSFSKSKTEYICKIDSPDFFVEKSIFAPSCCKFQDYLLLSVFQSNIFFIVNSSGIEVAVEVQYEPSKLGDVRTQLIVSSTSGGDYVCPLYGHCMSPRPQGPITIKPGIPATVPFKNVFSSQATYNFIVVNSLFILK